MKITKPQQKSLLLKFQQSPSGHETYLSFRRSCQLMMFGDGAIVVKWCNMWLAIEPDGYAHS